MKNILFLWLMLSSLLLPSIPFVESFDDEVNAGYGSYVVIDDYENNYFRIKIIQGVQNGHVSFGVLLYNAQARSHTLVISLGETNYTIPQNSRGDYYAIAITAKDDVVIHVLDEVKHVRYYQAVDSLTKDAFLSTFTNTIQGDNHGAQLTSLRRNTNLSPLTMLTIIFAAVILVSLGIIILMITLRRGIFHPDRQLDEIFQYRDFVESMKQTTQAQDNVPSQSQDNQEEESQEESNPVVNFYPYMREYDEEEEDSNDVDVVNYLRNKGYNMDYKIATDEEKNDIMLELMKMRDFHDITEEQYKKEVIKLWRK